jgi:hypothetical protein
MSSVKLEIYKDYLNNAIQYYFSNEVFMKYFNRVPKSRYYTFKYCFEHLEKYKLKTVVELGTSRSFVDGRFEGCNSSDIKYWMPNNPERWDWSAGCFTKVALECLNHLKNFKLYTVDLMKSHIDRCMIMNGNSENIVYNVSSSEDFLNNFTGKIDLLYLDTGDMTPIEETAQLHLREAKIIVEKNLISKNGLILIDDVRSCIPYEHGENINLGKGYLSIPYFLNNGFEIIMDEYQMILKKK